LSDVFHVALKEISQLLHGGTQRNPEAESGEIDCPPRPFLQDVMGRSIGDFSSSSALP
jgi:hypothetical protein